MLRWSPGRGLNGASSGYSTNSGLRRGPAGRFRETRQGGALPPGLPKVLTPSDEAVGRESQKTGKNDHRAHQRADNEPIKPRALLRDVLEFLCHDDLSFFL